MRTAAVFATTFLTATAAFGAADPPRSGVEIGARFGHAFAAGNLGAPPDGTDASVSDFVSGQWPLWLDLGYRIDPALYLGGFFQYGWGVVNDDQRTACRNANYDCSASDVRLGVMGRYTFAVPWPLAPWLGLGAGYEWGSYKERLNGPGGGAGFSSKWSGYEFVNVQVGADYRVSPLVALAPFVGVSLGQFHHVSTTTSLGMTSTTTDQDLAEKSFHEWIMIGVRLSLTP
jgi:hypothetical protein